MFKTILKWAGKIIAGIFLFYLFVCWIVLPLAGPWAIKSQGSKILKTTVKARSMTFNPFLWRLNLKGLEVLDAQQQPVAGFDLLRVNVSFVALFKKMIRVESVLLDGLKVHAILQPDGSINLLSLVPPPGTPAAEAPATTAPTTPSEPAKPLPLVVIDDISLVNGAVRFTDQSIQPNFNTVLGQMNIHVTGVTTKPDARVNVTFEGKLDDKGAISARTTVDPFVTPPRVEASFSLDQYAMQILSPYTGKYTGRALADGNLGIKVDYRIADNQITAGHKLLIQRFTFGEKVESKDALNLPFGLAVALLEDPQGKISISLPVKGDMSDPEFEYMHLVGQVARNFFLKLVTKPFSILASTFGSSEEGTEELGTIKFVPGKADLSDEESEKLKILAKGFQERPKLRLEINGTYDPDADWKAMKAEVFDADFKALQGESTKGDGWVYQQLYERQFGVRESWKFVKAHKKKGSTEETVNADVKKAIIEFGSPDRLALDALAQARAQKIQEALLAEGFDAGRMTIGMVRPAQATMGFVPLEFTLTVFGETPGEGDPATAPIESDTSSAPDV